MTWQNEPLADKNAVVPEGIVSDLRKLGFTVEWLITSRPTYGALAAIERPAFYGHRGAVTDAVLEVLRFTPNLRDLDLSSTKITDDGMAAMRYVPLLEHVDLTNTNVSDVGIRHLLQHRHLRRFIAGCSGVTVVGERLLRASIPGCDATIGRIAWRGKVLSFNANIVTVEDRSGEIWSVVVSGSKLAEFATEFANPIGRTICFLKGEPPEANPFGHFLPEGSPYAL